MNAKDIGERLRFLRTVNNLSQTDIAFVLHITRQAYSNYELGKNEAPLFVYTQIASIFDASESWIMTGQGDPFSSPSEKYDSADDLRLLVRLFKQSNAPYREKVLKYIRRYCS